ncbi:MAG TPA: hypothetical protein VLH16_06520 [Bacteroidales bacterium]|nr:hypothetical protein [Bacteroidales bacterium]
MAIRIIPILKNKYLIASIVFAVWLIFFDTNNLIHRRQLKNDLRQELERRDYYLNEIRSDSISLHELLSDTAGLIRFARERYLMKRDTEDVFLIIREPENP